LNRDRVACHASRHRHIQIHIFRAANAECHHPLKAPAIDPRIYMTGRTQSTRDISITTSRTVAVSAIRATRSSGCITSPPSTKGCVPIDPRDGSPQIPLP
jgi:hypothetical protein